MRAYQLKSGAGLDGLNLEDVATKALGAYDVRVRVNATALNYRDLMYAHGHYFNPPSHALIPIGDGVGEVIETGAAVTRFKNGDRVLTTYFPLWTEGELTPEKTAISFGAQIDGVLAEELVANENGLALAPRALSNVEAATIPCAGVTAWSALFVQGQLKPGSSVLILGTGGVAVWALQLAKAAGLRAIVLSSSDEKLERAKALGAAALINYRRITAWEAAVQDLTDGRGVDLVVEVGGEGTLARSLASTRAGGTVVVIGGLSGFGGASIPPGALIGGAKRLAGVSVGSRAMLEDLVRFVDVADVHPVISRQFAFEDARQAYEHLEAGGHFGKIVIEGAA